MLCIIINYLVEIQPKKAWHFSTQVWGGLFFPPSLVVEATTNDCFGGGVAFLSSYLSFILSCAKSSHSRNFGYDSLQIEWFFEKTFDQHSNKNSFVVLTNKS
jgi:hypothetical protein